MPRCFILRVEDKLDRFEKISPCAHSLICWDQWSTLQRQHTNWWVVYNLEMARVYNYLLQLTGKAFTIIHGLDGYDEISLTNDTKVITNEGEKVMTPASNVGKRMVSPADISGGNSVEEAAKIFSTIVKGEGSWAQHAVVLANAAMALNCTGKYSNYNEAYNAAVESLESGRANAALTKTDQLAMKNIFRRNSSGQGKTGWTGEVREPGVRPRIATVFPRATLSLRAHLMDEDKNGNHRWI